MAIWFMATPLHVTSIVVSVTEVPVESSMVTATMSIRLLPADTVMSPAAIPALLAVFGAVERIVVQASSTETCSVAPEVAGNRSPVVVS